MPRHNEVHLYGFVTFTQIQKHKSGASYAVVYVTVARSNRNAGDERQLMKCDSITVMCRDEEIVREMGTWKKLDFVEIQGQVCSKVIKKGSYCEACGERNVFDGAVVYVHPIFAQKRLHFDTQEECMEYLSKNREVSNRLCVMGTLCRDPKKVTPKAGLTVTQYPIAINRKFHIRTDDPQDKTDYPWVKSYGKNAISDRKYLHMGSEVLIDGFLQGRKVNKHAVCAFCRHKYDWADHALELVPYETEYTANYYTEEEAEERQAALVKQNIAGVLSRLVSFSDDAIPDDKLTDQDFEDGMVDEEI